MFNRSINTSVSNEVINLGDLILSKLLIGCDPEVFMYNRNNKQFVSAWGRIPGTKNKPYKVKNGAVQVDGNALEFNTDPAASENEFLDNIESVYTQLKEMVPGYECVAIPHVKFTQYDWEQLPKEAKELGCDPDFNAYTQKVNVVPEGTGNVPERDGAGHIHLGWTEGEDLSSPVHFEDCIKMIKQLDWALGGITCEWDTDDRRRNGYGKPGSFRVKSYGVEYRYPSNVWINNKEMQSEVYRICVKAFNDLVDGKYYPQVMTRYYNNPDSYAKSYLTNHLNGRSFKNHILEQGIYQYAKVPKIKFDNYVTKEIKKPVAKRQYPVKTALPQPQWEPNANVWVVRNA